jgi:hypothetical protein
MSDIEQALAKSTAWKQRADDLTRQHEWLCAEAGQVLEDANHAHDQAELWAREYRRLRAEAVAS